MSEAKYHNSRFFFFLFFSLHIVYEMYPTEDEKTKLPLDKKSRTAGARALGQGERESTSSVKMVIAKDHVGCGNRAGQNCFNGFSF